MGLTFQTDADASDITLQNYVFGDCMTRNDC